MDRNWETIRDEAFELDTASQALLVDDLVEHLAETPHMKAWLDEVERRDKEWDAGLVHGIDGAEAIRQARARVRP